MSSPSPARGVHAEARTSWPTAPSGKRVSDTGQVVAAPVKVCGDCGYALSAPTPQKVQMPMYALANDNWIGRMPFPLALGGEPLPGMELESLACGRVCVKKVIAEPERQGPRDERQGGLRGNSIAFPQATAHVCDSNELPPPKDATDWSSLAIRSGIVLTPLQRFV